METFETTPKKWGNSLGIIIPKEIADEIGLDTKKKIRISISPADNSDIWALAGKLPRSGKSTQELLDETDAEFNHD